MVDQFYGGAAHSSSYPPTHCMMASLPSSGDGSPSSWDATGNYFQQPPPSRSRGFVGYGVSYFGCCPGSIQIEHLVKYGLTSLRLLQQIQSRMPPDMGYARTTPIGLPTTMGIELPHAPRNSIIQHAHLPHSPSRGHPGFLVSLHGEPYKAHGAFCRKLEHRAEHDSATSSLATRHSDQLNYRCIETWSERWVLPPLDTAWKAVTRLLSHVRIEISFGCPWRIRTSAKGIKNPYAAITSRDI